MNMNVLRSPGVQGLFWVDGQRPRDVLSVGWSLVLGLGNSQEES